MKNYRFLIEYDGSRYYGWQRQPDQNTIQGKLEHVLEEMCGRPIEVIGAGHRCVRPCKRDDGQRLAGDGAGL